MKIHLITAGESAAAVADRLAPVLSAAGDRLVTTALEPASPIDPSFWPHCDLRIVVSRREDAVLFELVDRSAAETGIAYIPVVFEHPRLRVGPTIVPGGSGGPANTSGGCHRCFTGRQYQHNPGMVAASALWEHYATDRAAGPDGHLPQHAALASALVARVVAAIREGRLADERNLIRTVHLLQGTHQRHELIPVHGCSRCARPRPDASWSALARELGHLTPVLERSADRG